MPTAAYPGGPQRSGPRRWRCCPIAAAPVLYWVGAVATGRDTGDTPRWSDRPGRVLSPTSSGKVHWPWGRRHEECTRRIKNHQALVIQGGRFCLPWEHPAAVGRATLDFVA
ncbi:MAG TPA: hypothetical protein VIH59_25510 [Candidatus Tectomicrobia bacterium]